MKKALMPYGKFPDENVKHSHAVHFYSTLNEQIKLITKYFTYGLSNDFKCIVILKSEKISVLKSQLNKTCPMLSASLANGQLVIMPSNRFYIRNNKFDPPKVQKFISVLLKRSMYNKYRGTFIIFEVDNDIFDNISKTTISHRENVISELLEQKNTSMICQYDRKHMRPDLLFEALRTHEHIITGIEMYPNTNYIKPNQYSKVVTPLYNFEETLNNIGNNAKLMNSIVEQRNHLEEIIELTPLIVVGMDCKTNITMFNSAAEDITGYKREEIIGKKYFSIFIPRILRDKVYKVFTALLKLDPKSENIRKKFPKSYENPILCKNGDERTILWSNSVIYEEGKVKEVISIGTDITERIELLNKFRDSESKYRLLVEHTNSFVFALNPRCNITFCNQTNIKTGYTPELIKGKKFTSFLHPDDRKAFLLVFNKVLSSHTSHNIEFRWLTKKGNVLYFETALNPAHLNNHTFSVSGISMDITSHRLMETELLKYRNIVETAPLGVIFSNTRHNINYVNTHTLKLFGYNKMEILKLRCADLISPSEYKRFENNIYPEMEKGNWAGEILMRKKDGSTFPGYNMCFVLRDKSTNEIITNCNIITDMSKEHDNTREKNELQNLLFQSQKMEAIGRLAGGISHDFNNLLTGILGNAQFILKTATIDGNIKECVDIIIKLSQQASHLSRQLLDFARQQSDKPETMKPFDTNYLIIKLNRLLSHSINKNIDIKLNLDQTPAIVIGNEVLLEQALLNICINSQNSMLSGGKLNIRTSKITLRSVPVALQHTKEHHSDVYVQIDITDTGKGMTRDIIDRIFEPFFTTKDIGYGVGLGLSLVYSIIKKHHGHIEVNSAPGKGSTFTIYLPATQEKTVTENDSETKTQQVYTGIRSKSKKPNVMVIEDESYILDLCTKIFPSRGFGLITSNDPVDAVKKYRHSWEKIDIVILDIIMPKRSGQWVFTQLRKINPSVKVIILSGYNSKSNYINWIQKNKVPFISKPFDIDEMINKIQSIIG
ncbi:MAG: PAS domain S-box protein [Elusimicrobiota bacterium]